VNIDDAMPLIRALAPLLRLVRTDVTAVKKSSGETAWTRDPLTKELVAKHLNGGPARGVSPIKAGQSVTSVGLFDLDSHKGESTWQEMAEAAGRICEAAALFGLQPIAFRSSGGRGIHLFFVWDEPQDAASVRAALGEVLAVAGYRNGTKGVARGEVEVFPKQDSVPVDGFGNQFILPLAGKSEPLDPLFGFEPMGRDRAVGMKWPRSEPVMVVERPQGPASNVAATDSASATGAVPLELLQAALDAIPNDGSERSPDYDEWRNIVFAVHHATGGSAEGYDLVEQWSAQNPAHDEKFMRTRVWPYIKSREGGKTARTLFMIARRHGWSEPHELWFEDLTGGAPRPFVDEAAPPGRTPAESAIEGAAEGSGGEAQAVVVVGDAAGKTPAANEGEGSDGNEPLAPADMPALVRMKGTGVPLATVPNLLACLRRADIIGGRLGFDEFNDELVWDEGFRGQWRPFTDADYVYLRSHLESRPYSFKPIGREVMRDCVHTVAMENKFDSAKLWLERLTWDGVPRVESFLCAYFGAEDSEYVRAVSCYLWTALAGRVMVPGIKADMAPIAIGSQGVGKSTGIEAMVPGPEFFTTVAFDEKEDDLARKMRGKLIAEIAELRGLLAAGKREGILAFMTRTHEEWVPKFKEFANAYARRLVFFGTTNYEQFLADETGHRRWLPFHAGVTGPVDVSRIAADRLQLWAEARVLFAAGGVAWQQAQRLAGAVHGQHEIRDVWEDRVAEWLDRAGLEGEKTPREMPYLTNLQVLTGALGFDAKHIKRAEEMRVGAVLRQLGYSRKKARVEGRLLWVFVPTVPTSFPPENEGGNSPAS
jgi:predicted P-loop ATPase